MAKAVIAATWSFGFEAVKKGRMALASGGSALDAVEEAAKAVEGNPSLTSSVGIGGFPNLVGEVELDASIMDGSTLRCGAVGAVKGVKHPITLARRVMELTPHVMLAGDGALKLARALGLEEVETPLPEVRRRWKERFEALSRPSMGEEPVEKLVNIDAALRNFLKLYVEKKLIQGHDTIGVVAMDDGGNIAAGVSTSGLGMKLPGRVGDSAVIGAGVYADNEAGAAVCTGLGELAMRLCTAKSTVDLMRGGLRAQEAAEESMRSLNKYLNKLGVAKMGLAVLTLDKDGDVGGAANHGRFTYALWSGGAADVVQCQGTQVQGNHKA